MKKALYVSDTFVGIYDNMNEIISAVKRLYKDVVYQFNVDTIKVYEVITEVNGYTHCGKLLHTGTSSMYYCRMD
jgi:hypothetical protein